MKKYDKLISLIHICCDNITALLDELDVRYHQTSKRIYGTCPIHNGDNPRAWNLYPDGDYVRGYWNCYSHCCEHRFKSDLVGCIHGILSNYHDNVDRKQAIDFLVKFCGYKTLDDIPNIIKKTHKNVQDILAYKMLDVTTQTTKFSRSTILKYMDEVPASYYIHRGYSSDILYQYDVGFVSRINRVVVPVYDINGKYAVGFLKRSINTQCKDCGYYHSGPCPSNPYIYAKWLNSKGFKRRYHLYNYWRAKTAVKTNQTVILVEGPGDVWKLEEAGIKNSVAILGNSLTEYQQAIIDSSWATNVIIALDNDEAGQRGSRIIEETLRRSYHVKNIRLPKKDIGELSIIEIRDIFGGY